MSRPISDQIQGTYFRLRFTVAILGLVFPVILWIGGRMHGFHLRSSMSAYYWATKAAPCPCLIDPANHKGDVCAKEVPDSDDYKKCLTRDPVTTPGVMRSYFVGFLFAVGAILFANKGYKRREDIALNIAGVAAVFIALFPMQWTGPLTKLRWMHGVSAITFFLSIAFVSAFCSNATVKLIANEAQRKIYRGVYILLGFAMFVLPITAYILNTWVLPTGNAIFWVEFAGIWAFAAYWIVKGIEMSGCHTEELATRGIPYIPTSTRFGRMIASLSGATASLSSGHVSDAVPLSPVHDQAAYKKDEAK